VILVLVAGNVPATLQIAACFPLRPVTKRAWRSERDFVQRRPTKDYGAENW